MQAFAAQVQADSLLRGEALALGAAAGLFTAWMERTSIGAQGADFALTFAERCLVAGRALWFYASKLVWPVDLMFTYPRWRLGALDAVYVAGVLVVALALVWRARRGHRGSLAAFLFFAGTLFPALGFLNVYPFLFSFVADHFQYLASLGILTYLGNAGFSLQADRLQPVGRVSGLAAHRAGEIVCVTNHSGLYSVWWRAALACLAVPAVLAFLTFQQCAMYRDAETLYRATLARNPASWMAHTNLAAILLRQPGHLPEAIAECEAALRLRPNYAEAHNNLGSARAQIPGRLPEALSQFQSAIASRPDFAEAHFNLANAPAQTPGSEPGSLTEYAAALRLRPNYLEAHLNRAAVLLRTGALPAAIAEFQAALAIDPHDAKAHNNLGSLLAQLPGRSSDAIAEYQAALRENPEYADAHYNLGLALTNAGRAAEAIPEFAAAVRLQPDSARAHYNLGVLLMRTGGSKSEALAHFEQALRLRPDADLQRVVDRLRAAQR